MLQNWLFLVFGAAISDVAARSSTVFVTQSLPCQGCLPPPLRAKYDCLLQLGIVNRIGVAASRLRWWFVSRFSQFKSLQCVKSSLCKASQCKCFSVKGLLCVKASLRKCFSVWKLALCKSCLWIKPSLTLCKSLLCVKATLCKCFSVWGLLCVKACFV